MKTTEKKKINIRPYFQALPALFNYQIVTKILIGIWIFLLGRIFQALLKSSGRVAMTSGDWKFLFTTWQGLCIMLLGFISLFIYVALDLNSKIVLTGEILRGEKVSVKNSIRGGYESTKRLINLRGVIVLIYIALVAPILGIGLSITMTEGLYIPTFISSVIQGSVLYSLLSGFAVLLFLSVGIANLFILHGVILDKLSIKEAGAQSKRLIRSNWKDYLKQNVIYILTIAFTIALAAIICLFLPLKLITVLSIPASVSRPLTIFFVIAGVILSTLVDLLGTPLYLLKMTQLFYSYKQGSEFEFNEKEKESYSVYKIAAVIMLIAVISLTFLVNVHFDQMFPMETKVKVIAHRGGGNEGRENTLSGLEKAWNAGAYGSEIDIQRTKDGNYVVNHDSTFKRVAGVDKKPEEMTLREVKKLSIDGEPVPTFEEMLIASKGRIVLFTELKGNTADKKMADDAVSLIKLYNMEDECVLISLKYDVIDYIETQYPEMQTGFLTFASFGNTAGLNCDYLALEEESATTDAINSIHEEGKQVIIWTANEKESQRHFLCSDADGIITDNVVQAMELITELENRSDLDRMVDKIKTIM